MYFYTIFVGVDTAKVEATFMPGRQLMGHPSTQQLPNVDWVCIDELMKSVNYYHGCQKYKR